MNEGTRVMTPHGAGTVSSYETVNDAWPGETARWRRSGRRGVTLDVWPFAWAGTEAFYWPNELEKIDG